MWSRLSFATARWVPVPAEAKRISPGRSLAAAASSPMVVMPDCAPATST
jgi:hypothetical protein